MINGQYLAFFFPITLILFLLIWYLPTMRDIVQRLLVIDNRLKRIEKKLEKEAAGNNGEPTP